MAYEKLTKDSMRAYYDKAAAYSERARWDPNDPTTDAMALANNAYAAMNAAGISQLINGINDLLERVDRIEQMLKSSTRPR